MLKLRAGILCTCNRSLQVLPHLRGKDGRCHTRLLVTLALDAPDDADPQGIKEKVAMDFEKYGGVRVVKVERVEEYQQMTMEGD